MSSLADRRICSISFWEIAARAPSSSYTNDYMEQFTHFEFGTNEKLVRHLWAGFSTS